MEVVAAARRQRVAAVATTYSCDSDERQLTAATAMRRWKQRHWQGGRGGGDGRGKEVKAKAVATVAAGTGSGKDVEALVAVAAKR